MHVVVAYDTPSDKRRQKLLRHSRGALFHAQKSLFEGSLRARDVYHLRRVLASIADRKADRVRIFVLCKSCAAQAESLAGPDQIPVPRVTIVGDGS